MKIITAIALFLGTAFAASAQYYYKDIMATQENNRLMKLYNANRVHSITARGFDGDGKPSNDFSETQTITASRIVLSSRNAVSTTNQYFNYNSQLLLASITDTSTSAISTTTYTYNGKGNVATIQNTVNDDQDSIFENEKHVWLYNETSGVPEKMYRIVNNSDTTEIRFTADENGNVIEEQPYKKGRPGEKIYYYYDDKNRLTDIVRYNARAQRLLPDFMFEYSADDRITQKVTTLGDMGLKYLYWRYAYNDKGLKTKEVTFNRDKESTGRIEYSYQFGQ